MAVTTWLIQRQPCGHSRRIAAKWPAAAAAAHVAYSMHSCTAEPSAICTILHCSCCKAADKHLRWHELMARFKTAWWPHAVCPVAVVISQKAVVLACPPQHSQVLATR